MVLSFRLVWAELQDCDPGRNILFAQREHLTMGQFIWIVALNCCLAIRTQSWFWRWCRAATCWAFKGWGWSWQTRWNFAACSRCPGCSCMHRHWRWNETRVCGHGGADWANLWWHWTGRSHCWNLLLARDFEAQRYSLRCPWLETTSGNCAEVVNKWRLRISMSRIKEGIAFPDCCPDQLQSFFSVTRCRPCMFHSKQTWKASRQSFGGFA